MQVRNVMAKPHWPWDGKIEITFSIAGGKSGEKLPICIYGYDNVLQEKVLAKTLSGDGVGEGITLGNGGPYTAIWDFAADYPGEYRTDMVVRVELILHYLVVNLETGKWGYSNNPPNLSDDTCRTTELWLRRIPKGTFTMGSPEDEVGRYSDETQHQVTLTQDYYIGVFEMTQRQYELITGNKPSYFSNASYYATRPVEKVSYNMIRGSSAGAGWPSNHDVDSDSFLGKLRSKTKLAFDLPTEAQWEYACRAGTTTSLNTGKNVVNPASSDANLNEAGRNWYNGGSGYSQTCGPSAGTARVGSYLPNAWGLYDMHGNVWEWCLDWYGSYSGDATDPAGAQSGSIRVLRGGSWSYGDPQYCRSARRYSGYSPSDGYSSFGFRVVCLP